ncbi:MAG: GTP-binding protein [Deltaproteobacteria bacterium]|nr:GTP-binding protein [Deltaproteobacteria bacterium]
MRPFLAAGLTLWMSLPAPAADRVLLEGLVVDGDDRPIARASVTAAGFEVRTGTTGKFTLAAPKAAIVRVKMPGFAVVEFEASGAPEVIELEPRAVRAAYLTYWGLIDRRVREPVEGLLASSELDALVVDVKGDRGFVPYATTVPLAVALKARGPATFRDFDRWIAAKKREGIYLIARIVVFKDNVLSHGVPELAVKDSRTGLVWRDRERLGWVDPLRPEVWEYNVELAAEAARLGFDEIQFDYVRFPTDGDLSAIEYSGAHAAADRVAAIKNFLGMARQTLSPMGVFVAADIFGYTAFNEDDLEIGQRVEDVADVVDYLCPMIYPSGYHLGVPGHPNPVAHPEEVAFQTIQKMVARSKGRPVRVRPWIQDFRDYAFDRRAFGVKEIRAQIRGAARGGAIGYMVWNPRNVYTGAAYEE